jgi:hypothetical protein
MSMFKLYLTATDKPAMDAALLAWGFVIYTPHWSVSDETAALAMGFLVAPDEEAGETFATMTDDPALVQAAKDAGVYVDMNAAKAWTSDASLTNVHPVGTIWRAEPIRNADDVVTTPGVTVPGFHVNITCANPDLADACEALVVEAGESKTVNGIYSCHPNSPALRI